MAPPSRWNSCSLHFRGMPDMQECPDCKAGVPPRKYHPSLDVLREKIDKLSNVLSGPLEKGTLQDDLAELERFLRSCLVWRNDKIDASVDSGEALAKLRKSISVLRELLNDIKWGSEEWSFAFSQEAEQLSAIINTDFLK